MTGKQVIRDNRGIVIGSIETMLNGDKRIYNGQGVTIGWYKKDRDVTTDINGRILYRGDMSTALLR